ncbi:MAG: cobalamin-dependent protein [Dehalococcoidia bacterium]|jgi:methanogenic corrinoid protein MtbC1/DNA-binding XRE family transcriptional regulator|nr:cobalamin-dependent protein [Dehalococcoidia bacterium]
MNSSWYVPPKTEIQAVSKQFSSCLINGHYKQANLISRMLITQQWSPAVVYLNIIRKTLNQVGNLWHQGKLLITEEHRATQFCLLLMDRVRNTFKLPTPNGMKISMASIEDDKHVIALYMTADFFRWDGWNVEMLGGSIPNKDLVTYIDTNVPNFVLLSSTFPQSNDNLEIAIEGIKSLNKDIKVIIGGPAASLIKDTNQLIDGFAEDPVQAVSIANSLSESNPALIPLESVLLSLGEKIHSVRKNLDLSQSELSKKSGLARTFISAVEQGKQNVSLGSLKSISDSLGVPLATLLKD